MSMLVRLSILLLKRIFWFKKQSIFDKTQTHFLVLPTDLDVNFHMNNGRYLSVMDLGRFDMLLKAKVFWTLGLSGYYPVVVSESIRFKRSLSLFERYSIETQIESWDEKDFYLIQTFHSKNEVVAIGYIKGRFKKRGTKGSIPTDEILKVLNQKAPKLNKSNLALAQDQVEINLNSKVK